MEQNFDQFTAANNAANEHAKEIAQTRVGGLGGSDAAMVLRIAQNGIQSISQTDERRLAVMMGLAEQRDFGGNAYTNAGHMFEDYVEREGIIQASIVEREKKIEQQLAREFNVFAHADYVCDEIAVVECKYVQKPTSDVMRTYMPQLQWYYMLGAQKVWLLHGMGDVEPFCVDGWSMVEIERDQMTIDLLLEGLRIIDAAIDGGWTPQVYDKQHINDVPEIVRQAYETVKSCKVQIDALTAEMDSAKAVLIEYMRDLGTSSISDGESKVIYTKDSTTKTFDSKKFLKDHPEYEQEERGYIKTSVRKGSLAYKQ